ncbi:putative arylsulfatase B isoform X2 [Apostichopus japonicus]|uniref:Putative arylsulfatase B isoform X2 n=1 Tax=Stichopus japonicus TaxID=307972 RepID=A0A2G8LF89_STIJA|nr:putative arylsulfatase B isoform X2 [Apostichopus japonicus]
MSGGALPSNLRGTVQKQMMHVSDWFPTLVEGVAGGSISGLSLDGFNQWMAFQGKASNPRKEILHNIDPLISAENRQILDEATQYPVNDIFSNEMEMPAEYNTSMRAALRVGDWKILTGFPGYYKAPPESNIRPFIPADKPGQKIWLFNITADPNEYKDMSDERPDVVKSMIAKLKAYYNTSVPVRYPSPSLNSNPALHLGVWGPWED